MGLEAETTLFHQGKRYKVKALWETTELILRGNFKRRIPAAALKQVAATKDTLTFEANGEAFALALGAKTESWARKIAEPPPSLAAKLGLKNGIKISVIGKIDDPDLEAALKSNTATTKDAGLSIALCRDEAAFKSALKAHRKSTSPIWLVNVKGPKPALGEDAIREAMRGLGFKDTKTCSVSATLAATRYNRAS